MLRGCHPLLHVQNNKHLSYFITSIGKKKMPLFCSVTGLHAPPTPMSLSEQHPGLVLCYDKSLIGYLLARPSGMLQWFYESKYSTEFKNHNIKALVRRPFLARTVAGPLHILKCQKRWWNGDRCRWNVPDVVHRIPWGVSPLLLLSHTCCCCCCCCYWWWWWCWYWGATLAEQSNENQLFFVA